MVRAWKPLRRDLHDVIAPIRLWRSSVDHVVDPSSARIIAESVGSRDVTERSLDNSYHVATLDNDAQTIFTDSLEFIHGVTHPLRPESACAPIGPEKSGHHHCPRILSRGNRAKRPSYARHSSATTNTPQPP